MFHQTHRSFRQTFAVLLLAACGTPSELEQLRARVVELEARVAASGAALEACEAERRLCLTRLEEVTCGP